MNFDKAFAELKKGKKIRRKIWEVLMHLRLVDGKVKTYKGEYSNFYEDANLLISTGWCVVDGDKKSLTFVEALEELKNKKNIARVEWLEKGEDTFVFVDKDNFAICKSVEFYFMPDFQSLCATDWEVMK